MKVIFDARHPGVEDAVLKVNQLLKEPHFFEQIERHPSFDLSTATPAFIAEYMRASALEFHVALFHPGTPGELWRYRKTFAYTDGRYPNQLFLNDRKLNRSMASIAATIVHECIHALDQECRDYTFGHGNNSPRGKENTAPYWIGNLAGRMLDNNPFFNMVFDQVEEQDDAMLKHV